MIGLLGKKVGMTQIFDEDGKQIPVTVLSVGPCHVTEVRTKDKHGYNAVQLGFDKAKEKNQTKPRMGQFKKAKAPALRFVKEIRTEEIEGIEVGQQLKVDNFEPGDFVDIQGISKGHGFQGVVKRHNMKGAQTKSHGSKHGREIGSTGMSATPARTIKGVRLPGQMGNVVETRQNVRVVKIDVENDLMAVKGPVPGASNGYLIIQAALKKKSPSKWKIPSGSSEEPTEQAASESTQQVKEEKASKEENAPENAESSKPKAAEAEQGTKPAEASDDKS